MELKKTPFHDIHVKLGAKMTNFAGYDMPIQYPDGIVAEHMAVLESVGVFDVSHMGALFVSGPKAVEFLQNVCSNDISKLTDGKAQYNYYPNDKGGIVDDFIAYCFGDHYMLVANAANIEKDFKWISDHKIDGVELENRSERMSILAVQGPKAKETIQKLVDIDVDAIPYYSFHRGKFHGEEVLVSNTGYTGAGGYELYIQDIKDPENFWNQLFEAGKEFDIKPVGLGARDTLRLEMGFCLYGNDIDDTTNPYAAGLGWTTKRGVPREGYKVTDGNGKEIGHLTSGTMSPALKKGIALGYVLSDYKKPETEVAIEIRGKEVEAEVIKLPFRK